MPNQEYLDFSKKKNNPPTYTVNKDGSLPQTEKASTAGMMGGAGLGALIGMGVELAKLRKKILQKWHRDTIIAQREGMPPPPRPDTSKGALMAILKGVAIGGAAGGLAGKFVPGVNDVAASMDGFVRKTLTGSKLTTSEDAKFSEMLPYLDQETITSIDFSNINPYELIGITSDDFKYALFSRIEDIRQENFARYRGDTKGKKGSKGEEEKLVQNNPKAEMDRQILGKSNVALPVLGALIGGSASALKEYSRAKSEWEWQYKEALERGDPPPPEPSIFDFIGHGAKGAMVGGIGGTILSRIGPGKAINDKLGEFTDKWGITTNRKKANELIHDDLKSKGELKRQKAVKNAANAYRKVKKGAETVIDTGKKVKDKAADFGKKVSDQLDTHITYESVAKPDLKEAPSFPVWLAKKAHRTRTGRLIYKRTPVDEIDPTKPEWAAENKEYWDYIRANYKMFSYVNLIDSVQESYFSNKEKEQINPLNYFEPNSYSELINGIRTIYFSEDLSGEEDGDLDNELTNKSINNNEAEEPVLSNKPNKDELGSRFQKGFFPKTLLEVKPAENNSLEINKVTVDSPSKIEIAKEKIGGGLNIAKDKAIDGYNATSKFLKKGSEIYEGLSPEHKVGLGIGGSVGLAGLGLGMALKASKDEDKKKNKNFSYTKLIDSVYEQYFNGISEDIIPEDIIPEDIIPEDKIHEKIIPENIIHEDVIHEKIIPENVIHENIIHEDLDEPVTGPELERIKSIAKLYNMTLQEAKDYMETGKMPQQIKEQDKGTNNTDASYPINGKKAAITAGALGLGSLGAAGLSGALINNQVNKRKKDKNFSYIDLIDNVYEQYFNKGN